MNSYKNEDDDGFNHVKEWLTGKLAERGLSTNRFAVLLGQDLSRLAIQRWYSDQLRPSEASMRIVCELLSRVPVIDQVSSRLVKVDLEEGLRQFTPRPKGPRPGKRRKR